MASVRPLPAAIPQRNNSDIVGAAVIAGVGAAVYFFGIRPWWNKRQEKNKLIEDQKSTVKAKPGKVLKTITGKPVSSVNLSTIVFELERAMNFPTDQDRVVAVFRQIPFGYVKKVEQMYMDKFGENMKQRLNKKLSDENWIKIKYTFEGE